METIYWPRNMYKTPLHTGVFGTVSDFKKAEGWDWAIEIFLGTIWEYCRGDFEAFIKELVETWLEEFLHVLYRWERVESSKFLEKDDPFHFPDEEEPVRTWVEKLCR
jgi:hypothetical protein